MIFFTKTLLFTVMILPFEFISDVSQILIASDVTAFTLSVTLLGRAIEYAREDESQIEDEQTTDFQEQISDLENRIQEAKKNNNPKCLMEELQELQNKRKEYEKKLSSTKRKYALLSLNCAVINPVLCFIAASLIASIAQQLLVNGKNVAILPYIFIASIVLLFVGSYRLTRVLMVVEEIASKPVKTDNSAFEKLGDDIQKAFKQNVKELKAKDAEKLTVKFTDDSIEANTSTEVKIKFRVTLDQGKMMNNVKVWFFVPDDIILVDPDESTSWRQSEDYDLPGIKTVKVSIGNVSIGPYSPGTLKIKTPEQPGTFKIYYRLYADGYQDSRQVLEINVKE